MKGIWRTCGCPCNPLTWQRTRVSTLPLRKLIVENCPQGCPPGPYMADSAEHVHLHLWLQTMSTLLRAWQIPTCQTSQLRGHIMRSTVRMWLLALETLSETILRKQLKKRDRDVLRSLQSGVQAEKGKEGKSVSPGLPMEHRPLPCTPHSMPAHRPEQLHHAPPPRS